MAERVCRRKTWNCASTNSPPLGDIQRWAGRAGEPLFDSLLVFENFPVAEALQQGAPAGLSFSIPQNHERTNFPLTLAATAENQLSLNWSYQCSHFSREAIARMSEHLAALLAAMVAAPQAALSELDLLTARGTHPAIAGVEPAVHRSRKPAVRASTDRGPGRHPT